MEASFLLTSNVQSELLGRLQQLGRRRHLVHQAQLLGSRILDWLAREHHFHGLLQAHGAGQALRAAKAGDDA